MGTETVRKGARTMSLRHTITIQDVYALAEIRVMAFEGVAKTKHYKALYEIQKKKDVTYAAAIKCLLENKEFAEACVEYVNSPEVYKRCMEQVIETDKRFAQYLKVPNREADFVVSCSDDQEVRSSKIYFFIDEGIELDIEDHDFTANRLLVDHFTDTLLYNSGDGWHEYTYDSRYKDSISSKTVTAFRNYLADKQLLGDKDEQ